MDFFVRSAESCRAPLQPTLFKETWQTRQSWEWLSLLVLGFESVLSARDFPFYESQTTRREARTAITIWHDCRLTTELQLVNHSRHTPIRATWQSRPVNRIGSNRQRRPIYVGTSVVVLSRSRVDIRVEYNILLYIYILNFKKKSTRVTRKFFGVF